MITAADLKRFAPKARPEYVTALLGGIEHLRDAGILDSPYRVCHFMAQVGHETGGFTVVRESLHYTSAKRLREVWPARFRTKTDAELAGLLRNGIALGDAVYGGRMGNDRPGDGYAYRGSGFLQTTGKSAVAKYATKLNLRPSPDLLDDIPTTLRFACLEWSESGCSDCADENDITKVSKAINTGSATSNIRPVDLERRKVMFAKAWGIWGDKGKPDVPAPGLSLPQSIVKVGTPAAGIAVAAPQIIPAVPESVTGAITNAQAWKGAVGQILALGTEVKVLAIGALVFTASIIFMKWRGA